MTLIIMKNFVIIFLILLLPIKTVKADRLESAGYRIEFSNINIGSGVENDSNNDQYRLSTTLGQTAAGRFQKDNYLIRAGFQYIHSIVPFTFSISKVNINFGVVEPNVPKTDSTVLKVSFGGAGNYQVTAVEEGRLRSLSGQTIEDTGCDDGRCDEKISRPWISTTTYGFGYNLTGDDIPSTFISCGTNCYRRFPNSAVNPPEPEAVVMNNQAVTQNKPNETKKNIYHQAVVNFKLNTSPIQPAGTYQTIVKFVAVPTY